MGHIRTNIFNYSMFRMEDVRNIWFNTTCGRGGKYQPAMDPEEVMRRVPGITRREVEHILTLGLSPPE
jgi:hypothetical protein